LLVSPFRGEAVFQRPEISWPGTSAGSNNNFSVWPINLNLRLNGKLVQRFILGVNLCGLLLKLVKFGLHAGLCRRHGRTGQQRQHHRQHHAADGNQFWHRDGVTGHGVLRSRPVPHQRAGNGPRHSSVIPCPGRIDHPLFLGVPRIEWQ